MKLDPDIYRTGHYLVFDVETTNIDIGDAYNRDNRIVMAAWKERGGKMRHHIGNLLECAEFWEAVERADYLVAHNAKFEAKWFKRLGNDPTEHLWGDTMIAEYVRLGNRKAPLALDRVAQRYGLSAKDKLIDSLMKGGVCPSQMPQKRLLARCRRDVRTTEQIWKRQVAGLGRRDQLPVLFTRCLLTPILAEMEGEGMCLDKSRVHEKYAEQAAKAAELGRQMDDLTGGINTDSPAQMAKFIYGELKFPERKDKRGRPKRNKPSKQFPDGMPKTDKITIEWLETKAKTKRQREFISLRRELGQVQAALSKNLEFFKGVVDERKDKTFRAKFNQCVTKTHRLSSSGMPQKFEQFDKAKSVQFQNMPRLFKALFTTRHKDYYITEVDGSQLEFRVAAFLGQDTQAIADIQDPDFDAHVKSASVMNELEYADALRRHREKDKAMKELRQRAKPDTFKPLYGGKMGTPAQERWYKTFQERYAELYETQEGWVSDVLGTGRLETPWGLRFYWRYYLHSRSGTPMGVSTHKSIVPQVFNSPVQCLATAEIIPIAIVHLHRRCKKQGLRVRFVNTVHDSVIAEVHKDDMEAYKKACVHAFTYDVYKYLARVYGMQFNVPLGCEVTWGTHWGEGDEYAVDIQPLEE